MRDTAVQCTDEITRVVGSIREVPATIGEVIRGRSGAARMGVKVGVHLELTVSVRPEPSFGIQ